MAPHSSPLAWKIPWTEEPGRLQSMGSLRVGRLSNFNFPFHFHALEKEMATHSSVLAWRIPGMGEPGGLPSMGSHRVGHDWRDSAAAALAFPYYHSGISKIKPHEFTLRCSHLSHSNLLRYVSGLGHIGPSLLVGCPEILELNGSWSIQEQWDTVHFAEKNQGIPANRWHWRMSEWVASF